MSVDLRTVAQELLNVWDRYVGDPWHPPSDLERAVEKLRYTVDPISSKTQVGHWCACGCGRWECNCSGANRLKHEGSVCHVCNTMQPPRKP